MNQLKSQKYRNKITVIDGIKFHSKKEAIYYSQLLIRKSSGLIAGFERQVKYPCMVNMKKICTYIADFVEYGTDGSRSVIDVKGYKTPLYLLKKKLVEALYGFEVIEK